MESMRYTGVGRVTRLFSQHGLLFEVQVLRTCVLMKGRSSKPCVTEWHSVSVSPIAHGGPMLSM